MPAPSPAIESATLVAAFVRGELHGDDLARFEKALDESPSLQRQVAELAGETTVQEAAANQPLAEPRVGDRSLLYKSVLGRGGMATVYAASQSHMGREVAVKRLPADAGEWEKSRLLQEARVTGFLEHPGIVPVHDVLEDEHGDLQVVLKRIEGQSWHAMIAAPEQVDARFKVDPLDWHVSVAIDICKALEFAHQRGVVHRDIKPANVMIGRFGEVYLLDWGVAGTLQPDPTGTLPCVADAPLAGTLSYMAPEQLAVAGATISFATDTFLLGACLFHAMYGDGPYPGQTLDQRRAQPDAPITFPDDAPRPDELVALVRKALRPDPRDRFRTAGELLKALQRYAQHRDARRLAQRAAQRFDDARKAWAANLRRDAELAAADADFGFRAALELQPDDASVKQQRALLSSERVRFAVAHGENRAASYMLAGLEAPPATLVRQVDRAVMVEDIERERLSRIALGADRRFGLRWRRTLLGAFGVVWWGHWAFVAISTPATPFPLTVFLAAYFGVGVVATVSLRKVMLAHRLNREMVLVNGSMVAASAVWCAIAPALGLSMHTVLVALMVVWALGMASIAVIVELASLVPAICWLLAAVVSAWVPSLLPECLALGASVHVVAPILVSLRVSRRPSA